MFVISKVFWIVSMVGFVLAQEDPTLKHNKVPKDTKFRSARVNQVWEKANRRELSTVLLTDLFAELKEHDQALMELKQTKANGGDDDGSLQLELDRKFKKLMRRYGLLRSTDEEETNILDGKDSSVDQKPVFQDIQLNKLWIQATKGKNLNRNDLEKLHIEFKTHEEKIYEHQRLEEIIEKLKAISENSLEKFEYEDELHEKEIAFEHLKEEIKNSYDRLHLITQKTKGDAVPFSDPKAMELWKLALAGNHTNAELENIKQELQHFETRQDKHRHFRDELRNSAAKIDHHGGKHAVNPEKLNRHQKLQDKVQDLAYKAKKMFASLREKLSSKVISHNEL